MKFEDVYPEYVELINILLNTKKKYNEVINYDKNKNK